MQERKVKITYEAVYDIADAEEYIFCEFGKQRADEYHKDIYNEIKNFAEFCAYGSTGCYYRGYTIFKKPFKPSIIFGVIIGTDVHVLRVTREEYNWQDFFDKHQNYNYRYSNNSISR